MAYTLQALIADAAVIEANSSAEDAIVMLPQGKALLPLVKSIRIRMGISCLPLTDDGKNAASEEMAALCRALPTQGKVAYVEAEIFGGAGTQACILAELGRVDSPYVGIDAINRALQFLGVEKGTCIDEFEALGLGRHRETEEWVADRKA